jgi:rubredoxin
MERWVCKVCGYVYIPEVGHLKSKIPKGTKWEDVPEDWVCPLCSANKDEFEKIEN